MIRRDDEMLLPADWGSAGGYRTRSTPLPLSLLMGVAKFLAKRLLSWVLKLALVAGLVWWVLPSPVKHAATGAISLMLPSLPEWRLPWPTGWQSPFGAAPPADLFPATTDFNAARLPLEILPTTTATEADHEAH